MELAVGLFALALLVSALVTFALYIVRSLEIENHLRGNARGVSDKIEVNDFSEMFLFGARNLHIREPFGNVNRTIP